MPVPTAPANPPRLGRRLRPRLPPALNCLTHPDACGIDVGSSAHFVAVPPGRDAQTVREFSCFTHDLQRLVLWLRQCRVRVVAMESTGVYWIPLYELLQAEGFEVHLVNARHVRNVPGRKSDVLDCQWLQQLMSCGLLRGSFRPNQHFCALRALWRHRDTLRACQASHVQRMQKALTQMNLQLHHVITDLMGATGQAIVRAIVAGERRPEVLAEFRDRRIKASREDIAASLHGCWRDEHLFTLRQDLALHDFYAQQIAECDAELERRLVALKAHELPEHGLGAPKRSTPARNTVRFDARRRLYELAGVDLTRIPGIDANTALKILSEIGTDLSRFPSVKHFTSWLSLCPGTKISGGKTLSSATRHCPNRAAQALRMAAQALRNSQTALGAYHRRLRARMDTPKVITACAHKLARLVYFMLTRGAEYVEQGLQHYEDQFRQRTLQHLAKRANSLGLRLVPADSPAAA